MAVLPISNIINVSITVTPSGATERNVNSLALFTNDAPGNADPYRIYISAAQVAEDYGTSSVTARMANAIFAQSPNIRTGNGRLVIIPMEAVSATSGTITTADISANLTAIRAVSSGDIRVTVDGVASDLRGLNFTNASTFTDIAAILQSYLPQAKVTATGTGFSIASKKVGSTSSVTMGTVSGGTGTVLNGSGYFNTAGATTAVGANSTGETLVDAIARTDALVSYTGVISNLNLEDDVIEDTADAIQAMDKIYLQHVSSPTDILGIGNDIKEAGNTKTRILLHTAGQAEANLFKAAYAGRAFSVNFTGSNTSQSLNIKQLATIEPDSYITQTLYEQASTNGVDLYVSYEGVPGIFNTGGNDFFDNPYSDLALKFALQTAGFNFLRQTNTKVPQTEQGMNGLKSAYAGVLERFVRNGAVAPGAWTSSETFGDPEIFRENVLGRGYYIYSLPIVQQSSVERDARKAPLCQIAVKRAGAIHTSDVIVVINN